MTQQDVFIERFMGQIGPPKPEALAEAIAALRTKPEFRDEVRAPCAPTLIPVGLMNADSSVDISYLRTELLREYLRIIEAQEAAAAAASEAMR